VKNSIIPCFVCKTMQSSYSIEIPHVHKARSYIETNLENITYLKAIRRRRRMDSCENCLTELESDDLFPPVLHKMLNEKMPVRSALKSYLNYACSFRVVKLGLFFIRPFFLPLEFAIFVLRGMKQWLLSAGKYNKLFDRILNYVDFILKEAEDRNILCDSRISCHISSGASTPTHYPSPTGSQMALTERANNAYSDDINFDSFEVILEQTEILDSLTIDFYCLQLDQIVDVGHHLPRITEKSLENSSIPISSRSRAKATVAGRSHTGSKRLLKSSNKEEKLGQQYTPQSLPVKNTGRNAPAEDSGVSVTDDGPSSLWNSTEQSREQDSGLLSAIPRFKTSSSTSRSHRRHTVGVSSNSVEYEGGIRRGNSNLSASSLKNHGKSSGKVTSKSIHVNDKSIHDSSDTSDTGGDNENLFVAGRRRYTSRGYDGEAEDT